MSVINKHISIPKNVKTNDDLDYFFLKKIGMEALENLGGSLWTDFNSHDPGITMLEMLCYAITDLGMRIDTPMNNLLASEKGQENTLGDQFYKASDIFPSKAVTECDYRKLFIDIPGVKNCWLRIAEEIVHADCKQDILSYNADDFSETHDDFKRSYALKGLYKVLVDFEQELGNDEELDVIAKIKSRYHAHRNLCEDLIEIVKVQEQPVAVCAAIEVHPEADEELVHAKIQVAIESYFANSVRFYSIKEMMAKGYGTDQIFDGPVLDHGFIDIKELKEAELRSEVRLSDLMKIIMNIEGVKLINDISIGHCDASKVLENDWVICIDDDKKPKLCDKSIFNYSKGALPLNINQTQVNTYLEALKEDAIEDELVGDDEKDLKTPSSTYVAPDAYTTIQNDFPETFGIGQTGLAARATVKRKAQAKQLKAYLIFFDKILATYFKHLGKVSELLSINGTATQTYFTQAIKDIEGFDELIGTAYDPDNNEALTALLLEQFDNNIERRNQILDHLLSRFAERFGDYTFLMKTLYGSATNEIVLSNKEAFLSDYIAISSERGCGFNYSMQGAYINPDNEEENLWNTNNISGFQKRVSRLLGIKNYNRRNLSNSFVEVYSLVNSDAQTVFRWRIRDEENTIILSATEPYNTISAATDELYFAVLQIVQTHIKDVETAYEQGFVADQVIGNLQVDVSPTGKYSFSVINPEQPNSSTDYIVAKQYRYYDTALAFKDAIIEFINFMMFKYTEEGMFLVEHILLRPFPEQDSITSFMPICTDNCEDDCGIDPYSYRVSIILPGYTYRFSNPDFRHYAEMIIKEELPAHILPKICWVGYREGTLAQQKEQQLQQYEDQRDSGIADLDLQIMDVLNSDIPQDEKDALIANLETQKVMLNQAVANQIADYLGSIADQNNDLVDFENAYKAYWVAKTCLDKEQPEEIEDLLKAMANLNTIYPVGRLLDCNDESDELEGRIILGQTNIGTL